MKDILKWFMVSTLLITVVAIQADPIKDNVLGGYKAGWFPNIYKGKLMNCPQTCKVRVSGISEHEMSMGAKSKFTNVCKVSNEKVVEQPQLLRSAKFLYGNQFDKNPICYTTSMEGKPQRSKNFYCLCIADRCNGPDLVVTIIEQPVWDSTAHRSVIKAVIQNIGNADATASIARVIDPSTPQPGGAPYNAIANTPVLVPGATATVTFYLPYWVYNPNADLEVTADYKGMVKECNEKNNTGTFHRMG